MRHNPYIGPRPFERADRDNFFGRMRETRDLLALIIAERIVLFYAQSGAGKTSLLNTQIIPALEEEGFHVLPLARVGSDVPLTVEAAAVKNIFVFSALLSLAGATADPHKLLDQTLADFLQQHTAAVDDEGMARPPIVIFDQFEEILIAHRERWEEARDFFKQLREALRVLPKLGVVLAMREDHVAGLDPYAILLPKRLRTRFRMELLGYDGALEAVRKPAQNAGIAFGTGVAERLVDDLRRIQRAADRSLPDEVYGPYVEPVQLQVVCSRLWDNLPEREERIITWPEVEQFGNIDRALTGFYESALEHTVQATSVSEKQLRRWFGQELITPMKTRGLALRGEQDTSGLANEAVDQLELQHVIRAEVRAGAHWYELAHDRLVDPIMTSNAAWEQARMTPLRTTAQNWQQTKNADLLYGGRALLEAKLWATTHPAEVEDYEREFLEASVQAQRIKARNRTVRLTATAILAFALLFMAGLAVFALNATRESNREKRQARSGQLAAQAQDALEKSPQRSVLLALEAISVTASRDEETVSAAEQALRDVLSTVGGQGVAVSRGEVRAVAVSPDGRWLVRGGEGIQIHDLNTPTAPPLELPEANGTISALAFSRGGKLAASSFDGTVRVWDSANWSKPLAVLGSAQHVEQNQDFGIGTVATSPDERWLAAGDAAGVVRLWPLNDLASTPTILTASDVSAAVWSLAFSPDSAQLYAGDEDGNVTVWATANLSTPSRILHQQPDHYEPVYSLAVSPDGQRLATTGSKRLKIWNTADWSVQPIELPVSDDFITAVAFSPDGQLLAAGGLGNKVYLWENRALAPGAKPVYTLSGHEDAIYDFAFSLDSQWLFSASRDGTLRRWHLSDLPDTMLPRALVTSQETYQQLSPRGRYLILNDGDGVVRLLDLTLPDPAAQPIVLRDAPLKANPLAMSDDEHWLAAIGREGTPRLWDVTQSSAPPISLAAAAVTPSSLDLTADGRWLIGSNDHTVYLWNVSRPSVQPITINTTSERSPKYALSPNGRWLAIYRMGTGFQLWDLTVADPSVAPIALQPGTATGALPSYASLKFSPDGRWLMAGIVEPPKQQGTLWVWDLRQLPQVSAPSVLSVEEGVNLNNGYSFSPQSRHLLALSSAAGYLWDLASPDFAAKPPVRIETGAGNSGASIAVSPDEHWLAIGGLDKSTRLWNMRDLSAMPKVLLGQNTLVAELSFSADSERLATSGPFAAGGGGYYLLPHQLIDSIALLWNLKQPQLVPIILRGGTRLMTVFGFGPDGRWLITLSDRGVQLWDVLLDRLKSIACEVAGRNFTQLEWSQYFPDQPYSKTCDQWPLENSGQ